MTYYEIITKENDHYMKAFPKGVFGKQHLCEYLNTKEENVKEIRLLSFWDYHMKKMFQTKMIVLETPKKKR